MGETAKRWLGNLGMLAGSLLATLLLLEYVVFNFVLKPDDLLNNVSINGVVRYSPGTRAVFRHPDGRETLVTINADGWNSTKPAYKRAKEPGKLRVAVIGDSYVHGAFVNVREGFPEVIEAELKRAGVNAEVYRFGMDGAPLSQYLHMLRQEVRAFKPDIVVVQLIHNDFDESYRFLKTRYASSFMKLDSEDLRTVTEIAPADFKAGTADVMRNLRTFRYLYYKTNFYLKAKSLTSRFFWGGDEDWSEEFISSAVDIRKIADHKRNRFFARYVMKEMSAIAAEEGIKLAFAMDGVREAIYESIEPHRFEVGRLNIIARELTGELGLPFLDLQQTFADDYAVNKQRFEFAYDWHWNVRANLLAGQAIARLLLADQRLIPAVRPARAAAPAATPASVPTSGGRG